MEITGTITQANGAVRNATRWDDGTVTFELPTMVRHGMSSASLGYAQRKATDKQAATFLPNGWLDIDTAWDEAHAVETPVATVEPTVGTYLDSLIDMIDEINSQNDDFASFIGEIDDVVSDVELEVPAPVENLRPYVQSNAEFMAYNALTVSARRYWARRAGLALAA
jgi:hypothetical protein